MSFHESKGLPMRERIQQAFADHGYGVRTRS